MLCGGGGGYVATVLTVLCPLPPPPQRSRVPRSTRRVPETAPPEQGTRNTGTRNTPLPAVSSVFPCSGLDLSGTRNTEREHGTRVFPKQPPGNPEHGTRNSEHGNTALYFREPPLAVRLRAPPATRAHGCAGRRGRVFFFVRKLQGCSASGCSGPAQQNARPPPPPTSAGDQRILEPACHLPPAHRPELACSGLGIWEHGTRNRNTEHARSGEP